MKTKTKGSKLTGVPAVALSLIVAFGSVLFIFLLANVGYFLLKLLQIPIDINEELSDFVVYWIAGIFVAAACYVICQVHPNSFWHTPILCNLMGLVAALVEPTFWHTGMWMAYGFGWVLSLIGTYLGTRKGRLAAGLQK